MKNNIDLTKLNENCMSAILERNLQKVYDCKTKEEVYTTVEKLLKENNLDTTASRRLLMNIQKSYNLLKAQQTVVNSYLSGKGLCVK